MCVWVVTIHLQLAEENKMRAGVLLMAMVCLSDGKLSGCSVGPIVTVSKHSKVSVSCPSVMANSSVVKYLLFFRDTDISQKHLRKPSDSASLFSGQFEVTANNSGVYICKREVIYPPPFMMHCHTTEVIVADEQSLPKVNDAVPVANQSCAVRSPFIPEVAVWAGCGVLLVYSLSITCITLVVWRKSKRDGDDTNEYINTRPVQPRNPCKV